MAILSQRMMNEVARICRAEQGFKPFFFDVNGRIVHGADPLDALHGARRQRTLALHESLDSGEPVRQSAPPGLATWVLALEDRRLILGGAAVGPVLAGARPDVGPLDALASRGMPRETAAPVLDRLPRWSDAEAARAVRFLQHTFQQVSGWRPLLMQENRLRIQQQQQLTEAIEDQRRNGRPALYAFEKERVLLARIRAGDRPAAKQILNDMLAAIYLSSPQMPVLRARAIEMISCLTRAAIEDNALLEALIERNHSWTERLVLARSFEELSNVLTESLDAFIDAIALHGLNRSNQKVQAAIDFVAVNHAKPISLRTVAAHVGLSPWRLAHLVKACTGRTVTQIIHQARIRQAQHLLERTGKSCTEIAYEVGFSDQSYFIKQFRRATGTTPRRHRRFRA
jgi:AraC-like DNA-binding protein